MTGAQRHRAERQASNPPKWHTTPGSTVIRAVRYVRFATGVGVPGADGLLLVKFVNGSKRVYAVPKWVPGLLLAARSTGQAYNRLVRGKYATVKL